jgi:hypothetical protein
MRRTPLLDKLRMTERKTSSGVAETAPRPAGSDLACPRDESTGKANGSNPWRRQGIMAHHDRIIDVLIVELRGIGSRGTAAKDANIDDAGRDVQHMRAFRFRRGFAVEQILISPMTRGKKLLVVGQA